MTTEAAINPDPGFLKRALLSLGGERKQILILISITWLVCSTLFTLPFITFAQQIDWPAMLAHAIVGAVGLLASVVLFAAVIWATGFRRRHAIPIVFSAAIALSVVMSFADLAIFDMIDSRLGREFQPGVSDVTRWFGNFAIFVSQFAVIAAMTWSLEVFSRNRRQEAEIQAARLAAAQAQGAAHAANLAALRYQLNPHFLFNTLNSISSLVVTGRNKLAEQMLSQLSDFLRVTLASDPNAAQTLEQELETIESYLNIERIRFGDRMAVEYKCPPELRDSEMPSFILQPLIENAVKHGVSEHAGSVEITIEATLEGDQLVMLVDNSIGSEHREQSGTGVGLRNVADRLQALYGAGASLETYRREVGFLSIVRLPYRIAGG